jgi:hypothetical protein
MVQSSNATGEPTLDCTDKADFACWSLPKELNESGERNP